MKKTIKILSTTVAIYIMGIGHSLQAQPLYKMSNSADINMKLSGTSTLHKWSMNTKTFTGGAQFGFKQGNAAMLTSLKSLNFSLPVLNLKSGEKKLDKNAYKALKTEQFKNIVYKLTSATVMPGKDNKYLVKANGDLSISGVTKNVAMNVYCWVNKDASITCTGTDKLKMTDYNVKPPSFMAGAMKTGDDITLDFTLVYKK